MGLLSLLVPPTLLTKQTTGTNPIAKVSTSLSLSLCCVLCVYQTNQPPTKEEETRILNGLPDPKESRSIVSRGMHVTHSTQPPTTTTSAAVLKGKCPRASCVSVSVVFPPPPNTHKNKDRNTGNTQRKAHDRQNCRTQTSPAGILLIFSN